MKINGGKQQNWSWRLQGECSWLAVMRRTRSPRCKLKNCYVTKKVLMKPGMESMSL